MEEMLSQELKGMEEYVWPFALFDMPRFVTKVASVYPVEASWDQGWGKLKCRKIVRTVLRSGMAGSTVARG